MRSRKTLRRDIVEDSDNEQKEPELANILQEKANDTAGSTENANAAKPADPESSQDQPIVQRRLRKIKRNLIDYEGEFGGQSNNSSQSGRRDDVDEEYTVENKLDRMKKRILGNKKKTKKDVEFDLGDESGSDQDFKQRKPKKIKKQRDSQKEQGRKKQAPKQDLTNINRIKTNNKLIGDLENNDLYASDEGLMNDGFNAGGGLDGFDREVDDARNQKLEFGFKTNKGKAAVQAPTEAKKGQFLQKMKTKRQMQEEKEGVEDSVVNLGFVKNLAQTMSANQLAASGIQLSMRDNLIKFINNMDQKTQNEEKLLSALQNSQPELKETEKDEPVRSTNENEMKESDQIVENKIEKPIQNTLSLNHQKSNQHSVQNDSESDEGGLLFYDPKEEQRVKKEKDLIENQRNRANLLKDKSGGAAGVGQIAAQSSLQNVNQVNKRSMFLNSLKNKQKQKNVMTLERVKATFQSTDFNEDNKKKKKYTTDGQEDLIEDRDSDSEFDEEKEIQRQKLQGQEEKIWDDEENFIGDDEEEPQGSESEAENDSEKEDKSEMTIDAAELQAKLSEISVNTSNKGSEPKRLVIRKAKEASGSQSSTAENLRRVAQQKKRTAKAQLAGFFDEEAELGSDDEEKDDARKLIDKNAADENEDGLDSDLDGFVVRGDDVEIGDADADMHAKFMEDVQLDEKVMMRKAMETAIFGKNRKRKRGEAGLDDEEGMLNDYEKRKLERLQEREQALNSQDEQEMEKQLLEGGRGRALEHLEMKQLIEEEELSEDEIQRQMEQSKYFAFLRENRRKDQLKSMEAKEKEMEEELGEFMVDLNDKATIKRQNTQTKSNESAQETATASNSTSKTSVVMNAPKGFTINKTFSTGGIKSIAAARLNQKKIQAKKPAQQEPGAKPKKASGIGSVATGMVKFMKRTDQSEASEIKQKLKTANNAMPMAMLFRQRKAQVQ